MKTLKTLMGNTPSNIVANARLTNAQVLNVERARKKEVDTVVFTVRCKAHTEKVYYDVVVEFYPTEMNKDVFKKPSIDNPVWVKCSCFTGDTKVLLANGKSVPIRDLVGKEEFFVYSYDTENKKFEIGRGHTCEMKEVDAELLEITLDSGKKIRCTLDHKFLLRDGETFLEAKDLKVGQSLQALYRRSGHERGIKNYEQILQDDGWEFTYAISDRYNIHNNKYSVSDGEVRHHKDFNKHNNDPTNIERLTWREHFKKHHDHMVGDNNPMKNKSVSNAVRNKNMKNGSFKKKSQQMKINNPMKNKKSVKKMVTTSRQAGAYQKSKERMEFFWRSGGNSLEARKKIGQAQKKLIEAGIHEGLKALIKNTKKMVKNGNHHTQQKWFAEIVSVRMRKLSNQGEHPFQKNRKNIVAASSARLSKRYHQRKMIKSRSVAAVKKHLLEYGKIVPEQFDRVGYPKLETIKRMFDMDEIIKLSSNHKIVSIKKLKHREEVYCFSVDKYENFVISADDENIESGIVVHNCPYFLFNCEYALAKHGSSEIDYSNGKPPVVTNPRMIPMLCKHLFKGADEAVKRANQLARKDDTYKFV